MAFLLTALFDIFVCAWSVMSISLQPMDCILSGFCGPWNFPGKNTLWVDISYSRASSQHRDRTHVSCISCIGKWILHHWASREALQGVTGLAIFQSQWRITSSFYWLPGLHGRILMHLIQLLCYYWCRLFLSLSVHFYKQCPSEHSWTFLYTS